VRNPVARKTRRHQLRALYAAGFVTAFSAHAVAANLGGYATRHHASLLELGILLAIYDGAELVLKPVFGVLADRTGTRPVLIGGLVGFAGASAAFVLAGEPDALGLARLAQGASAAAFSPAASATVAALGGKRAGGRAFGGYGAAKGLGYMAGPFIGGGLVTAGGYNLLFAAMAVLALSWRRWPWLRCHPCRRRRGGVKPSSAWSAGWAPLPSSGPWSPLVGPRRRSARQWDSCPSWAPASTWDRSCAVAPYPCSPPSLPWSNRRWGAPSMQDGCSQRGGWVSAWGRAPLGSPSPSPFPRLAVLSSPQSWWVVESESSRPWASPSWRRPPPKEGRARPWRRPRSGGNWATPVDRCW